MSSVTRVNLGKNSRGIEITGNRLLTVYIHRLALQININSLTVKNLGLWAEPLTAK